MIECDTGLFGPVPAFVTGFEQAVAARKVGERPFNLLKHMDGVEPARMKSRSGIEAQVLWSHMVGLFKVMAGLRAKPLEQPKPRPIQEMLRLTG